MYSLILKDIILQKKIILFNLAYSVVIFIAFQSPAFSAAIYVMGAMIIAYMMIMGATAYEDKTHSDVILNSLPIDQATIVKARYLSALVFLGLGLLMMGVSGALLKGIGLQIPEYYLRPQDVVGALVSIGLVSSIYFPFFFKFGYIKARVFHVILFLMFFFLPSFGFKYLRNYTDAQNLNSILDYLNSQPDWLVGLFMVGAALFIMFLSLRISMGIYRRREF